jgi:hypothetical protein
LRAYGVSAECHALGLAAAVALVGIVALVATKGGAEGQAPSESGAAPARGIKLPTLKPVPRENAVLVFGSTGKLGRLIVAEVCLCVAAPHCNIP